MTHGSGSNWQLVLAAAIGAMLGVLPTTAQDFEPPDIPPEQEQQTEPRGTLKPRPAQDAEAAAWVRSLGGARPRSLSVRGGPMTRHVLDPSGERFYYYRRLQSGTEDQQGGARFALYAVGPERTEHRVAETGADATPPLFLPDGRILFTARRYDLNDDGVIDEFDDATLVISNRDGGNQRNIATLAAGEVPVAIWREGREVLLAVPTRAEAENEIVSLHLQSGAREFVVRAFNVAMVLDDGRLLIERMQASDPELRRAPRTFGRRGEPVEQPAQPEATLLDHVEFLLHDTASGQSVLLFRPSRPSRISVSGEGTLFGEQERDVATTRPPGAPMPPAPRRMTEILIIDDAEHRDSRSPSARFSYEVLAWIERRGLLVVERGNLGSRLLLLDRSLKTHQLASFELHAVGFRASRDGLTVGWLEVEDSNRDGRLEPWVDNARPFLLRLE